MVSGKTEAKKVLRHMQKCAKKVDDIISQMSIDKDCGMMKKETEEYLETACIYSEELDGILVQFKQDMEL